MYEKVTRRSAVAERPRDAPCRFYRAILGISAAYAVITAYEREMSTPPKFLWSTTLLYAVMRCLSVCPSVCSSVHHVRVFCRNE